MHHDSSASQMETNCTTIADFGDRTLRLRGAFRRIGSMPAYQPMQLFEFASEKAADNPRLLPCIELWSIFSVAVGTDSDADTRGMNADAAALPIAAALVTLVAGSISIRIMGLANDDAAFTTFAPATA
jgi:hypothetical protein